MSESGYDDVDFGDAWREAAVGGQAEHGAECHPGGVAGYPDGRVEVGGDVREGDGEDDGFDGCHGRPDGLCDRVR